MPFIPLAQTTPAPIAGQPPAVDDIGVAFHRAEEPSLKRVLLSERYTFASDNFGRFEAVQRYDGTFANPSQEGFSANFSGSIDEPTVSLSFSSRFTLMGVANIEAYKAGYYGFVRNDIGGPGFRITMWSPYF